MFGRKPANPPVTPKLDTIIGNETIFEGNIRAAGSVRVDGEFKGEVKTKGDLVIGDSGRVEATVEAANVLIAGYMKGNILAHGKVDLSSAARLYGDIEVQKLVIEEGAVFRGNCFMESAEEKAMKAGQNVD